MSDNPFELAKDAIQRNNTNLAHRRLFDAIGAEPYNINFWLLLAWTTPDARASAGYFNQVLRMHPENILAQDGLAWAAEEIGQSRGKLSSHKEAIPISLAPAAAEPAPVLTVQASTGVSPSPGINRTPAWLERLTALATSYPLLYLLAILLAEVTTVFLLPQAGLAFYGVLLLILIGRASTTQQLKEQRFLLTLALVPLIRLVGLSMPLASVPVIFWYIVIGVPLFIGAILAARVSKMSSGMLGLNGHKFLFQFLIGLSGIVLGYVEYLIFKPTPLVSQLQWGQLWMPILILILFSGLLEEFIFRGVMQSAAIQFLGRRGIVYISLIFSVLHLGIKSTPDILLAFAIGLFFGYVVLRTGSILGVVISHSLMNILVYLIFPFVLSPPHFQVYFLQNVVQPLSVILASVNNYLMMQIF